MIKLLAQTNSGKGLGGNITGFENAYNPTGSDAKAYLSTAELIISNVLTILTIVAGIAFTLYFLLGGLNWITSGGDKQKVETAKSMMTNGAIGLIIIVVSYSIVWIVGQVLGIDILKPADVLQGAIKFK